jgi:hypothetical protein
LFVIGLVATLIVTIFVARVAKRALDQSVAESQATDAGSQKTAAQ